MIDSCITILTDYSVSIALISTLMLGLVCGMLSAFVLLRKQAMLGDAISHAALPGIILGFLLTHSRNPLIVLIGGASSGVFAIICMKMLERTTTLKKDAIIGVIVSVFFGCALVLMTLVQKASGINPAFLHTFLFGNVSTLLPVDVRAIAWVALCVSCVLIVCWKECVLFTFDPIYAHTQGYNIRMLDYMITALLMAVIVVGLQTVGVVLISSLLIAPAVAVRPWCSSVRSMALSAGVLGACAGVCGALISCLCDHMPTGPIIVVLLCSAVAISYALVALCRKDLLT